MRTLIKKIKTLFNKLTNKQHNNNGGPVCFTLYGSPAREGLEGAALTIAAASYPSTVAALCYLHGAKLIKTNEARGYWKGKSEISFFSIIETDEETACTIARKLAEAYKQECTALFRDNPTGPAAAVSVDLSKDEREQAKQIAGLSQIVPGLTVKERPGTIDTQKRQAWTPATVAEIITEDEREAASVIAYAKRHNLKTGPEFSGAFSLIYP